MGAIVCAHLFMVNCTFNAAPTERLQQNHSQLLSSDILKTLLCPRFQVLTELYSRLPYLLPLETHACWQVITKLTGASCGCELQVQVLDMFGTV